MSARSSGSSSSPAPSLSSWRGAIPSRAKPFFAAGAGFLGFGLFRLFLFAPFAEDQVWFAFWEELTELIFLAGAAAVLWFFRHGFFGERVTPMAPSVAA